MSKPETIIYNKGSRQDSIPFAGCFNNIDDLYKSFSDIHGEASAINIMTKLPKDYDNKKFVVLSGKSAMEEIKSFYEGLLWRLTREWIKNEEELIFIIFFEYFNSGTSKAILSIIQSVFDLFGSRCRIIWLADEGDDDNYDSGRLTRSLVKPRSGSNEIINFIVEEVISWLLNKKGSFFILPFFCFSDFFEKLSYP